MKPEILVFTAFSPNSRNALQYACEMAMDRGYTLLLAHNYDPPLNYAADAVAFSSLNNSIADTEDRLKEEAQWARTHFPAVSISHRLTFGTAATSILEVLQEYRIDFLIAGAPESQGEFWGWNDAFVDVINQLPVPTLIIPGGVSYQAIGNIGFACDYAQPLQQQQLDFIRRIMDAGPANLHIIHVSIPGKGNEEKREQHRFRLEQELHSYHPVYASIENTDVVATIIHYIMTQGIQLLIVIPHRHGIWYSIFNQRHTRRLTRINHLPIMALQDQE